MRHLVPTSFIAPPESSIPRFPFEEIAQDDPSFYQVEFLRKGIRYIYGFQATDEKIVSEWAYFYPTGIRTKIFEREGLEVTIAAAIYPRYDVSC